MMPGRPLSLILLPTLRCNAECDYCFENKSEHSLDLDQLAVILGKLMDRMDETGINSLAIYWQGGEVMTLAPEWFLHAHDLIRETAVSRKKQVFNYLQSNLLEYGKKWDRVISEMFGSSVGSSMDYPNLHRKLKLGGPKEYDSVWRRKLLDAREAGIQVGVIAIPNELTVELGAESFYSHFVDELGINDFQVNTPFPGGNQNDVKTGFPLGNPGLSRFLIELADLWVDRGIRNGVRIGPFDQLMNYFVHGDKNLLCVWRENCAGDFICIDPRGYIAQCDCWVSSYPEFHFGNILESGTLADKLVKSAARQNLLSRPGILIQREDCLECDHLSICHGGCPVRAYTVHGDLMRKDPYCGLYKELFGAMEKLMPRYLDMTRSA